jgi:AcrR family transcriptional regulator
VPRAGLNTAKVVEQAAQLADETGWDRLSLAGLAARCGVKLPSLYKHIASLDALRLEVSALALRELAAALTDAVLGKSGRRALHALAEAYRDYARRHPGRYAATVSAPTGEHAGQAEAAREVLGVVQATLAGYGLTGGDATDATRALRAALHGFVHLEAHQAFGLPADIDRSYRRLVDGIDATMSSWADDEAVG